MSEIRVGDEVICRFPEYPDRPGKIVGLFERDTGQCAYVETDLGTEQWHVDYLIPIRNTAVPSPLNQPPLPPVDVSYVAPHYDPPRKYSPQLSGWRYVVAYAWECGAAIVNLFRGSHKDDRSSR